MRLRTIYYGIFHSKIFPNEARKSWVKYVVLLALIVFISIMILSNVKSKNYYQKKKVSEIPAHNSEIRSIISLYPTSTQTQDCITKNCAVTCSGDMTNLKKYLQGLRGCGSYKLRKSEATFPNDRLSSNWLQGNFVLSLIEIKTSTLREIEDGAFNDYASAKVTELELNAVQLVNLTENTFIGLKAIKTFTLVNKIPEFSGDAFLKPMEKTLEKIVIQHVTSIPTDPAPWLRGGAFGKLITIVFDGSNLGGYVNADTFQHLSEVQIIMLNSCKITHIADGTFDFIMNKIFFLLSLQNNQLKRLSGEYLKKVGSLKGVDLLNNPWDCTCELEELIGEFKRYPNGFNNETECQTPPKFAGKRMDTVDVERCEDTTITVINKPLPTILAPTPSSSTKDPDPKTTPSPTEPPKSSSDPTPPSIATEPDPKPTPSIFSSPSTLPPPTTAPPTSANGSSSHPTPTTESFEIPATASTLDPATPTTPITTGNDDGGIIHPPQTTPSPQNRTTTLSEDTIIVECQRYKVESPKSVNEAEFFVELSRPDTHFIITSLSRTSAQLQIENPSYDLALIWFYDQPSTTGSGENTQIVGEFKMGCQSVLEKLLIIEGLVQKRAYTFCLVRGGIQVISPFNCQSFFPNTEAFGLIDESEVWLKRDDQALTIGLLSVGIIILICLVIVGTYLILRLKPSLLKGSKRVIVVNRSTGDILILPRPYSKSSITDPEFCYTNTFDANTTNRQRRFSETSIQSGLSYMVANNYEDIEYRWKMNVVNDKIYANRVPKIPAPPLPKRVSHDITAPKYSEDKLKVSVILPKGNDYGYIA